MSCVTDIGRTGMGFSRSGRKSYSSDNLALDYDLFMSQTGLGQTYGRKSSIRSRTFIVCMLEYRNNLHYIKSSKLFYYFSGKFRF